MATETGGKVGGSPYSGPPMELRRGRGARCDIEEYEEPEFEDEWDG